MNIYYATVGRPVEQQLGRPGLLAVVEPTKTRVTEVNHAFSVKPILVVQVFIDGEPVAVQRESAGVRQFGPTEVEQPANVRTQQTDFAVSLKLSAEHVVIGREPIGVQGKSTGITQRCTLEAECPTDVRAD